MRTIHKAGWALQIGFWAALRAVALVGCRSPGGATGALGENEAADAAAGAATDAVGEAEGGFRSAPVGIYTCILKSGKTGSMVVLPGSSGHNPCEMTATELAGSSRLYCDERGCPPCLHLQQMWNCPLL